MVEDLDKSIGNVLSALRRSGQREHTVRLTDGADHLYDLAADVREQADLAKRRNDDLAALRAAWEAINARLLPYRVVLGFFTALSAGKNGSASFPKDIPQLSFMIVPISDLLVFIGLFAAAMYYRKRSSANHKRLVLLTAINFLPPALSRFPLASIASAGPLGGVSTRSSCAPRLRLQPWCTPCLSRHPVSHPGASCVLVARPATKLVAVLPAAQRGALIA